MMCCVSAAGHKLKLYQLSQGKTNRSLNKFKKYQNVILELSGTSQSLAWFKVNHLITYIKSVIIPYTNKHKSLLIIDNATWHRDDEIHKLCRRHQIELMYVPDRCTGSCQPLDVNVLGPVKQRTHNIFRRKQRSSMPSHFRLALKYECFVTAWNGTKRSTIIGAWRKSGL